MIIYDRGYPSYDFIYEHIKQNIDYLIRVKTTHSSIVTAFVQSGKRTITTKMLPKENQSFKDKEYDKDTSIEVRLVRVDLPSGETEVLITSLLDCQKYPSGMFKMLYFLRWGIETLYDESKNKLKIEHFTGSRTGDPVGTKHSTRFFLCHFHQQPSIDHC